MSLADELLADLEEDEEAEENQLSYEAEAGNQDESAMQKAASLGDHNPIPMDQGMLLIYMPGFGMGENQNSARLKTCNEQFVSFQEMNPIPFKMSQNFTEGLD